MNESITQVFRPSIKNKKFKQLLSDLLGKKNELKSVILSVVTEDGTIKSNEFSLKNGKFYLSRKKQLIIEIEGNSKVVAKTFTKADIEKLELERKGYKTEKDGSINLTPKSKKKKSKKKKKKKSKKKKRRVV